MLLTDFFAILINTVLPVACLGVAGLVDQAQGTGSDLLLKKKNTEFDDLFRIVTQRYDDLFNFLSSQIQDIDVSNLPDLSHITKLVKKDGFFAGFFPPHRQAVVELTDVVLETNSTSGILERAMALRNNPDVNPMLWFYTMANIAQKNPELGLVHKMSPLNAMPSNFINADALKEARSHRKKRDQSQACLVIDERFGADNGVENILWYFRESIPINTHHWYQHMMYPFASKVRENRRGELFYYMHLSLLSRYNAERLSNGLPRVEPVDCKLAASLQGYKAHLRSDIAGYNWTDREPSCLLANIDHQNNKNFRVSVLINEQIVKARERIVQAIDNGYIVTAAGEKISIQNTAGIDILGDIVLASNFSLNPHYYGLGSVNGLHGNGHIALSLEADPNFFQQLPPGVMADPGTAMRDVIFYRWHATVNEVFDRHKRSLTPYSPIGGELPLIWPGINITSFSVTQINSGSLNKLNTFWSRQEFELQAGLDLSKQARTYGRNARVCAKQLDHGAFTYNLVVDKQEIADSNRATVRIFMAPRFDEKGNRFDMTEQRNQFFVLDSFTTSLKPGTNRIVRQSTESTLTVPWARMLDQLSQIKPKKTPYCGCGWPQNMLLPKGHTGGMIYDLFVMLTNADEDDVYQPAKQQFCRTAPIYCGIANQLYPDAKPMGYPFDRLPYSVKGKVVGNLDDYICDIGNMAAIQVLITFRE